MFSIPSETNFNCSVTFTLSSAEAFNLDLFKILSFGKVSSKRQPYEQAAKTLGTRYRFMTEKLLQISLNTHKSGRTNTHTGIQAR